MRTIATLGLLTLIGFASAWDQGCFETCASTYTNCIYSSDINTCVSNYQSCTSTCYSIKAKAATLLYNTQCADTCMNTYLSQVNSNPYNAANYAVEY